MTKVIGIRKPWCVHTRQNFGRAVLEEDGGIYGVSRLGYGQYGFGESIPESIFHGIYQVRKLKEGRVTVQMKFYRPSNPRTEVQQNQRAKMCLAVSAWQVLTIEEKKNYNRKALGKDLSGYNLFIKQYLLSL